MYPIQSTVLTEEQSNAQSFLRDTAALYRNRYSIGQYRSRNPIDESTFEQAFSWVRAKFNLANQINPVGVLCKLNYTMSPAFDSEDAARATAVVANLTCSTVAAYNPIEPEYNKRLSINVFNTSNSKTCYSALKEVLDHSEEVVKIPSVSAVTNVHHTISVYKKVNVNDKRVIEYIVFTNKMSDEILFKLSGLLHNAQYSELETDIALSLAYSSGDETKIYNAYVPYIAERIAQMEAIRVAQEREKREQIARQRVAGIDATINIVLNKPDVDNLQRNLHSRRNDYLTRLEDLDKYYRLEIEALETKIFMATNGSVGEDEEVIKQYLTGMKDLVNISTHGKRLVITLHSKLLYWNEEQIKIYLCNPRSDIMQNYKDTYTLKLFEDILVNKKYTVHFLEQVILNYEERSIHCSRYGTIDENYDNLPSNPHHWCYDCWGDNASIIARMLRNNKPFYEVLATIQSAISSINATDSAVLNKFLEKMLDRNSEHTWGKFLEDNETHEMISVQDYVRRQENA